MLNTHHMVATVLGALALAACNPAGAENSTTESAGTATQDGALVTSVGFADLLRTPAAPFIGAEKADVTIIGFMDYNCPYCRQMNPELAALLEADPKVRILYKDWPIFGEPSTAAARTALAAGYQGKYEAVHNAFMRSANRIAGEDDIRTLAESAGVDMTRLDRDLQTHRAEIDAVLDRNKREASALALQGTPAFIINGNLIPGGMPLAQLQAVIARIRAGEPLR
ncbi:DsbA family protein [Brevundimonas sp.]|uniref:DsbA family protein n=1 Tax=Brevundimonas sp. TaxID=1871086 RepID=UPI00260974A5|nr:DsbA family protein [Brevundimonas sp.]MDP3801941.1 DsbA family protein [Brevundimonas sp.]